jgi:hypothetical protein
LCYSKLYFSPVNHDVIILSIGKYEDDDDDDDAMNSLHLLTSISAHISSFISINDTHRDDLFNVTIVILFHLMLEQMIDV